MLIRRVTPRIDNVRGDGARAATRVASIRQRQQFPRTQAEALAWSGVTFTSIYDFGVASSPLVDLVSGNNLVEAVTPNYSQVTPFAGKHGVKFDGGTGDRLGADVFDLDANTSALFVGIARSNGLPASDYDILGRRQVASPFNGYIMQMRADGRLFAAATDGPSSVFVQVTGDHSDQWLAFALQIDRAGALLKLATSRGTNASASIAAIGSLTNLNTFGTGAARGVAAPMTMAWLGVALGANAEGHDLQLLIDQIWRGP